MNTIQFFYYDVVFTFIFVVLYEIILNKISNFKFFRKNFKNHIFLSNECNELVVRSRRRISCWMWQQQQHLLVLSKHHLHFFERFFTFFVRDPKNPFIYWHFSNGEFLPYKIYSVKMSGQFEGFFFTKKRKCVCYMFLNIFVWIVFYYVLVGINYI